MYKNYILTLALLIISQYCALAVAPDIGIGSFSGFQGEVYTDPITIDYSIPVGAISFVLGYDSNLLTVNNVYVTSSTANWKINYSSTTPGALSIGMSSTDGTKNVGSQQQILNVVFTIISPDGVASLGIPNLVFSSVLFDGVSIGNINNGTFTLYQGVLGNPSGSGVVNIYDAFLISQSLNGIINLSTSQDYMSIVDGNQIIDAADANFIALYVVGAIGPLKTGN